MNNALMFSKASDEWSTPREFFDVLNAEFEFDVDAAATEQNKLVPEYFGLDHSWADRRNALTAHWGRAGEKTFWLNPPYSKCREFIAKAALEASKGCTVVCLVPSRTDTRWWHEHVWDHEKHQTRPGVEIRFVKGRLKFGVAGIPIRTSLRNGVGSKSNDCAPFPSVVIIFRPVTL